MPDRNTVQTLPQILELIAARHTQIGAALAPIIDDVQADLDVLAGKKFSSFTENKTLATAIQQLLNRLGELRVKCLKDGCHEPALLRCTNSKFSPMGSFHFEHSTRSQKTRHLGLKSLPRLMLTQASQDLRLKGDNALNQELQKKEVKERV